MASGIAPQPPIGGDIDRAPALLANFWTECSVAILIVALRWASRILKKNVGLDDWAMLASMILYLVLTILTTVMANNGGARHLYYLDPHQITTAVKYNWMIQPFGIMCIAVGKVAVGFLILRLLDPRSKWRKWFLYITLTITIVISAICCVINFVQCNPPRALWEKVAGSSCWNPKVQADYAVGVSSWSTFMDFALAIVPVTIIWKLQLDIRKKVGLCCLLSLGILAGICSAVKTKQLEGLLGRADFTWSTYDVYIWSSTEIFLIIFCGSVPAIKPLFDLLFKKPRSGKSQSHTSGGSRYGYWSNSKFNGAASSDRRSNAASPHGARHDKLGNSANGMSVAEIPLQDRATQQPIGVDFEPDSDSFDRTRRSLGERWSVDQAV